MFKTQQVEDKVTIRKTGFGGGEVSVPVESVSEFMRWMDEPTSPLVLADFAARPAGDNKSVILDDYQSQLTIKVKDLPKLAGALSLYIDARGAGEDEELAGELEDEPTVEEVVVKAPLPTTPVVPIHTQVWRKTYIDCGNCQTEVELGTDRNLNGYALVCSQCNSILLLEDGSGQT